MEGNIASLWRKRKVVTKKITEPKFAMPQEVKDWIDRAHATMNHQKGEIERLKAENKELKSYKKWAEHRILRSDQEE